MNAKSRSTAIAGSPSARNANRHASNAKSVIMIATISDRIRIASRFRSSRRGFVHPAPMERVAAGDEHGQLDQHP